jgi:hypothetical protein
MGFYIILPSQSPNTLNQTAPSPNSSVASTTGAITSHLAIIPLATLAGFNWEWAIMIFKRIGDSFKEAAEPKSKIGK